MKSPHPRAWPRRAAHRRIVSALALLLLGGAAACLDRPTQPAPGHRAPTARLDGDGNHQVIVGSTLRGIARLDVEVRSGKEPMRHEFRNERPMDEEAWGVLSLEPGMEHDLVVRGFDVAGSERFAAKLVVPTDGEVVRQVRAPIELLDAREETPDREEVREALDAGEVYAGSYRLGSTPRWGEWPEEEKLRATLWVHDARGERLEIDPENFNLWGEPELGKFEIVHGSRELFEVVLTLNPPPLDDSPPPPDTLQTVKLCLYGDLTCGHVKFLKDPPLTNDLYVKVVASAKHTCALRSAGLAQCFGDGDEALGVAAGSGANLLASHAFLDIDTNVGHGCGVDVSGAAWCWGSNTHGQLGQQNRFLVTAVPQRVSTAPGVFLIRVATGRRHTCAIDATNRLWCWGANGAGQLGDGKGGAEWMHTHVPQPVGLQTGPAIAVDAGEWHTCALSSTLAVECWGLNNFQQLGVTSLYKRCDDPVSLTRTLCELSPALVGGAFNWGNDVIAIGAGKAQGCAVTRAGSLFCWGDRYRGDGSLTSGGPVQVDPAIAYRSVAVGEGHACAVTSTGAAQCWGVNYGGQLGAGSASPRELVPGAVLSPPAAYATMGAGNVHSCGITEDRRELYCWGAGGSWLGFPTNLATEPAPGRVTVF